MIMAGVQAKELLISDGIPVVELMRTDYIAFGAEAKELSFDRIEIMPRIELLRENGIKRLLQPLAGCLAVHWDILVAVRNPNVRDARRAECFAHGRANFPAGDAMLNPELANAPVAVRQRETIDGLGVREKSWIEIEPDLLLLRPANPVLEMFRRKLVSVYTLASG